MTSDLKARLVEAYGGGETGEILAEAEIRFRAAKCAHLFCERQAYEDGGCQASGIPLCRLHAHLVPSIFDEVVETPPIGRRA
jgi:hypothetical protein